jgi:riboflavin kinase/FMN adenylyltransferase
MVTHGAGRGAKIGFPTANLAGVDTLLPEQGVYAGRAWVGTKAWPSAINLGPSPTFGDTSSRVEVHLIGYSEPLYGQPLEVDFLVRLRDIRPFDSPQARGACKKSRNRRDTIEKSALPAAPSIRLRLSVSR